MEKEFHRVSLDSIQPPPCQGLLCFTNVPQSLFLCLGAFGIWRTHILCFSMRVYQIFLTIRLDYLSIFKVYRFTGLRKSNSLIHYQPEVTTWDFFHLWDWFSILMKWKWVTFTKTSVVFCGGPDTCIIPLPEWNSGNCVGPKDPWAPHMCEQLSDP